MFKNLPRFNISKNHKSLFIVETNVSRNSVGGLFSQNEKDQAVIRYYCKSIYMRFAIVKDSDDSLSRNRVPRMIVNSTDCRTKKTTGRKTTTINQISTAKQQNNDRTWYPNRKKTETSQSFKSNCRKELD